MIVCTHQHTATSVPILVLVVVNYPHTILWAVAGPQPHPIAWAMINHRILLGLKKRGFGEGWWNGFGGKINHNETIEEAAKRYSSYWEMIDHCTCYGQTHTQMCSLLYCSSDVNQKFKTAQITTIFSSLSIS